MTTRCRFRAGAWAGAPLVTLLLALAGAGQDLHAQGSVADDRSALEAVHSATEGSEEQSVIDVAVFYTPSARTVLGGTVATEAEIDLMIAETNQAYAESGVNQRLSLVAAREVAYREYPLYGLAVFYTETWKFLANKGDGDLEEVHAVRDEVGADICVLLVGNAPHHGYARDAGAGPSGAFAVVGALAGTRVFARELGRIQGLRYDRYKECERSGQCPGRGSDFGYVNQRAFEEGAPESSRWRTLMSHPDQCDDAGIECEHLLRFSNPDQVYPDPGGDAMGIPATRAASGWVGPSNAVRMLNRRRKAVENFRLGPAGPTLTLAAALSPVAEGTPAAFTVTLSKAWSYAVSVSVHVTESGSALSDASPATMTIPVGLTRATLSVPTDQDTVVESDSTVTAAVMDGWGYTLGAAASASVIVEDDDARLTPTEPPPRMGAPTVREGGLHSLSVSWDGPDPALPRVTGYDLQYRKSTEEAWTDGPQDRTGTSSEIIGLDADTNYQVQVRAQNAAFEGAWSESGEGATALWTTTLTVGAADPRPRSYWGFHVRGSSPNHFGELSRRAFTYGGNEHGIIVLAWYRGPYRLHPGGTHETAFDLTILGDALPEDWEVRVNGTRFVTNDGFRATLSENEEKIYWIDPDMSLALDGGYEVVFSRRASAPKDANHDPAAPLTAEFEGLPGSHNGSRPFRFRLRFSEEIEIGYQAVRNDVFKLTGGTVEGASRLRPPSNAGWEITVRPSGNDAVSIAIPGNRPCGTAGAICAEGKRLSGRVAAIVPGPGSPELSGITIAAVSTRVTEGASASFTVTLGAAASEALAVPVSVTETGSMLSGEPPLSLAIAAGETTATLTVPTVGDSVVEADSAVRATVGSDSAVSASVTVADDDTAAFTVSADPQRIAEGKSATLTVAISNGVTFAKDQTVRLTTSGTASTSDFTGVPAALTLAAGASSVTAELAALADNELEVDETVTVAASHGGASSGSATVTVKSYSRDATLSALSLAGLDIGTFSGAVTSYEASAAYFVTTTTVTATPSHSVATVFIEPGAEVSLATGANGLAVTVTAEDGATKITYMVRVRREPPPEASITAITRSVTEGTAASFTVALDKAISEALTVSVDVTESGSALSGVLPASVTIPGGATSAPLSVGTDDDDVAESDSTVTATVTAGTVYVVGAAASASVIVEDDDARRVPTVPPARMGAPTVRESGLYSLSVSWSQPDPVDPRISGYDLQYRKSTGEAWTDGPQDQTGTSSEIIGLDGDTNYQVQARAQNAAFEGAWSEPGEGATALWTTTLTVGAADPRPRRYWGFYAKSGSGNHFGELAPKAFTYGGNEYRIVVLAWYRGPYRLHTGGTHETAFDLYTLGHALPEDWEVRVNGTRFVTNEGFRGTLRENEEKIFWIDPDMSLALDQSYEVVFSRRPSAPKDANYDPAAPLTAKFEGLPGSHNGSAPFTFRLRFSEDIEIGYEAMRNDVLKLTGGTLEGASRLRPPSNAGWEITVRPSGNDAVSIAIPGNRPCGTVGAICTARDKRLSGRVAAIVPGPGSPELSGITIAAVSSPVAEGASASFTVTLGAAASEALTVPVSVTETGSMLSGEPPVSLAVAAGDTTATLTVPTAGDSVVEADSTVTATAGSDSAASASVTVEDDDTAAFSVTADPQTIAEGESATLTVAISNGVTFAEDQTVRLTTSGTASASDFTGVPAALTLAAGASSVTAELAASADNEVEVDETVTVAVFHGGASIGSATVTVAGDEVPPFEVTVMPSTLEEGRRATVTVTARDGETAETDRSVALSVAGISEDDYTLLPASVTLAAGASAATILFEATADAEEEAPETATIEATVDGTPVGSATVTIVEDPLLWIEGVPQVASVLEAVLGSGAEALGLRMDSADVGYQWLRDDVDIEGATGASYALVGADARARLSVRAEREDQTLLSEPTAEVWPAPGNPPLAEGEVELLGTTMTLEWRQFNLWVAGYARLEETANSESVSFGDLSVSSLSLGGTAYEVVLLMVNAWGNFGLATKPALVDPPELTVYWDGHKIESFRSGRTRGLLAWSARTPQPPTEITRYHAGASDGVRVAVSVRAPASEAPVADNDEAFWSVSAAPDVIADGESATATVSIASADAALSTLRLSDVDIGSFYSETMDYSAQVGIDVVATTLEARASDAGASVTVRDGGGSTVGTRRTVTLVGGRNDIQVDVTSHDGRSTRTYLVAVTQAAVPWGTRLPELDIALDAGGVPTGNGSPLAQWSDGETVLVSSWAEGTLRAYRLHDGARWPARDIDTRAAGVPYPGRLWSDGTTLWVVDDVARRLAAFAVPGVRQASATPATSPHFPVRPANWAPLVPSVSVGAPVWIRDAALRSRITAALGKAAGEAIGRRELAALVSLDVRGAGIADLAGLEEAVNLAALDLGANPVTDLGPLASLPALTTLNLDGVAAEIWQVAGLTRLRRLSLRSNGLTDVAALAALTELRVLDLGDNPDADLRPLTWLGSLEALRLDPEAEEDGSKPRR